MVLFPAASWQPHRHSEPAGGQEHSGIRDQEKYCIQCCQCFLRMQTDKCWWGMAVMPRNVLRAEEKAQPVL